MRPSRHRFAGCLFGLCAAALVGVLAWKIRFLETGWCSAWHLYSLNVTCYVCVLFALALRYKPRRERTFEPELSIVLPVKNEEQVIGQAMSSCYEAAYPAEKRQVIVINDGSTDRTGAALEALRTRYPDLEVVTWECNRGKIHGMVEGLKRARGELVVFLDSDTVLERDALRAIAAEFHDPTVGAVSGHVDVLNAGVNFLTSAQAVWYFGAFRVFRAAEHLLSNVTCCPGAFCAYRAEYVAPVVEPWLQARVLGIPCTHGVDRGLTNQILRRHRVLYCSEAIAWTVAPDTWAEFLRQQVRWKKSWIRETIVACSFMYRKPPCTALFFYWSVLLNLLSPVIVVRILVAQPLATGTPPTLYLLSLALIGLLYGTFYGWQRGARPAVWLSRVPFGILYMLMHLLLLPYAAATIRDARWHTRE